MSARPNPRPYRAPEPASVMGMMHAPALDVRALGVDPLDVAYGDVHRIEDTDQELGALSQVGVLDTVDVAIGGVIRDDGGGYDRARRRARPRGAAPRRWRGPSRGTV